jgi:hypothetical protein
MQLWMVFARVSSRVDYGFASREANFSPTPSGDTTVKSRNQ